MGNQGMDRPWISLRTRSLRPLLRRLAPSPAQNGCPLHLALQIPCPRSSLRRRKFFGAWLGQPRLVASLEVVAGCRQQSGVAERLFLAPLVSPCTDSLTTFAEIAEVVQL